MFTIFGFYKFKKIIFLRKYKTYLEKKISNTSIRGLIIKSLNHELIFKKYNLKLDEISIYNEKIQFKRKDWYIDGLFG